MRVALLANAAALHTVRWANGLSELGVDVLLYSAHPFSSDLRPGIRQYSLSFRAPWSYFIAARQLRRLLNEVRPDLLNAHYASGYGTLSRLCGYRPLILSVWGSDVYDFPRKSRLHRRLIQQNLQHADVVCSISHAMASQCRSLCSHLRDVRVISWGVDTRQFRPMPNRQPTSHITIGTVKVLTAKYGIDTLIRGFAICRDTLRTTRPEIASQLRLRIVGDGPDRKKLAGLAKALGVDHVTSFVGAVQHDQVPTELGKLDVYVAVSRLDSESFGVAIVEASACGKPVVVSDAGGLPEVVIDRTTGFVVPRESQMALANKLVQLATDTDLREQLGQAGRSHVKRTYDWHVDLARMCNLYAEFCTSDVDSFPSAA